MDRIIGFERHGGRACDERFRSEQLRHRRAAGERCVRAGILRRCSAVVPTHERRSN